MFIVDPLRQRALRRVRIWDRFILRLRSGDVRLGPRNAARNSRARWRHGRRMRAAKQHPSQDNEQNANQPGGDVRRFFL